MRFLLILAFYHFCQRKNFNDAKASAIVLVSGFTGCIFVATTSLLLRLFDWNVSGKMISPELGLLLFFSYILLFLLYFYSKKEHFLNALEKKKGAIEKMPEVQRVIIYYAFLVISWLFFLFVIITFNGK